MSETRAIALGFFDGLHIAHRAVLEAACRGNIPGSACYSPGASGTPPPTDNLVPAVLLFDEHPLQCLRGSAPPQLLTDADRDEMLRGMGLELLKIPFREVMRFDARRFLEEVLLGRFHAGALCCGYHYHFGREGTGNPDVLRQLCGEYQIALRVVPKVEYRGEAVSSTRIREALERGKLANANAMLGRPFGYAFEVKEGARVGRTLGAPTINQQFPQGFVIPKYGVYASQAFVGGEWRTSVTNIGVKPTFARNAEGGCPAAGGETHIIGFAGELYGRRVPVRLLRYLRGERRFGSLEELKGQIGKDKENAGVA